MGLQLAFCFSVGHSAFISFVHGVLWSFDKRACCSEVWKPLLETHTFSAIPYCFLLTKDLITQPMSLYAWTFILFRGRNVFFSKSRPFAGALNPKLVSLASTFGTCSRSTVLLWYLKQVPPR